MQSSPTRLEQGDQEENQRRQGTDCTTVVAATKSEIPGRSAEPTIPDLSKFGTGFAPLWLGAKSSNNCSHQRIACALSCLSLSTIDTCEGAVVYLLVGHSSCSPTRDHGPLAPADTSSQDCCGSSLSQKTQKPKTSPKAEQSRTKHDASVIWSNILEVWARLWRMSQPDWEHEARTLLHLCWLLVLQTCLPYAHAILAERLHQVISKHSPSPLTPTKELPIHTPPCSVTSPCLPASGLITRKHIVSHIAERMTVLDAPRTHLATNHQPAKALHTALRPIFSRQYLNSQHPRA